MFWKKSLYKTGLTNFYLFCNILLVKTNNEPLKQIKMAKKRKFKTVTNDWKYPPTASQLIMIRTLGRDQTSHVNFYTLGDFLQGKNPEYKKSPHRATFTQLQEILKLVRGENIENSHINKETVDRFLREEEIFGEDYVKIENLFKDPDIFVWDSVKDFLAEDKRNYLPFKRLQILFDKSLRENFYIFKKDTYPRDFFETFKMSWLENWIFKTPEIFLAIFIKWKSPLFLRREVDNIFPILDKNGEVNFLRAWIFREKLNLELIDINTFVNSKGSIMFI